MDRKRIKKLRKRKGDVLPRTRRVKGRAETPYSFDRERRTRRYAATEK